MIHVVACRAVPHATISGPVLLRTDRLQDHTWIAALADRVEYTFDEMLNQDGAEIAASIASVLEERSAHSDLTYIVPGVAACGDAIVAALSPVCIESLQPAVPDRGLFGLGSCRVVDALELAEAEMRRPFDRGLVPVEPTIPLVVTNWYGERVTSLAESRLRRTYSDLDLPSPTRDYELLIPAVEHLTPAASMAELEQITARLRRPDGCPWDREQTRASLFEQFKGELDELGEAIAAGDVENQAEELGDLLFHVVAQCQLAAESDDFSMDDALRAITAKLVRRHPHVFGDVVVESVEDVLATWQKVKANEKKTASER